MQRANRDAAIKAFEILRVEGRNHALAAYWLSLWRGDQMPVRADFNPAKVSALLPGIGVFSVKPGVHSACRLAGTAVAQAAGRELTGLDWRQYTPKGEWQLRLERNSAIALGQVGIGIRNGVSADGQSARSVELQLPFADKAEDGTRQILFHLDWRTPDYRLHATATPGTGAPRVADAFQAIAIV
jgi:hypothetical protein